jgi:hypothetical protein
MEGGAMGGRVAALRGRVLGKSTTWVVTLLEVSLILALLLTGD